MTETVQEYRVAIRLKLYFRKISCLAILLTGVFTVISSQSVNFVPLTKLDIKNGLAGINARKITRDPFGFMWFATQDGLSRFDGSAYINLNSYFPDKKRKLLGTDVFDIKTDLTGRFLWALTSYGGLNKIDLATCNVVGSYQIRHTIKPDTTLWYKCLVETPECVIIGTNEGVISRFVKATHKTDYSISLAQQGYPGQLEDIFIDPLHRLWYFISGQGILITDSTLTRKIQFISNSQLGDASLGFTDYAVHGDHLYLTTTSGLKVINIKMPAIGSATNTITQDRDLSRSHLDCISVFGDVAAIAGTNTLFTFNLNTYLKEPVEIAGNYEDRGWLTLVNALFLDKNRLWIGSQYGIGWMRNTVPPFVPYYSSFDGTDVKIKHAITLNAANDSIVLVCADDGLYTVNHYSSVIKKIIGNDFFYSVFPVAKNFYIASGVASGLHLLNAQFAPVNILSIFPELKEIQNDLIMSSAKLNDTLIFMASQNKNGLYIWNTISKKIDIINTRTGATSLRNDNINRLYLDSKKRLWIVCENAVSLLDVSKRTITHLPLIDKETKTPLAINMDICEADGKFWLASYGTGIVEITDDFTVKEIYTTRNGINNLGLYKLFCIKDSLILATTNNGLSVLNPKSKKVKNYFTEDGLQSNNFEEASGDRKDQYIFIGGINGITRLDLTRFNLTSAIPRITFSTISFSSPKRTTDTLNIGLKQLSIPNDITQLTINFSAQNLSDPEKTLYCYRLIEKDTSWNITSQPVFQTFRLNPGKYHLQIAALNENGQPVGTNELVLIFKPKWYETLAFKLLLIFLFLSVVFIIYRSRINQLKKEERIRSRLARDLHDDLGSTLNSVKVYTNLAIMEQDKDKHLSKVKYNIQEAITSIRDLIWVLDDSKDSVQDLFLRASQFGSPLCEAHNMRYKQDISDDARNHKLQRDEKRNLYMILKEATNNACKYADATQFAISVQLSGKKPIITIADNGNGFDLLTANDGNGLKNISSRAVQIRYKFSIHSSIGAGTQIRLEKI
jgi:signal transduction histidine kinase